MRIRTKKRLAGTSNGLRRLPGNLVSRSWFDQPPTECTPREFCVDNQEFYQLLDRHGISDDIHLFNQKLGECVYLRPSERLPINSTCNANSGWCCPHVKIALPGTTTL